MNEISLRELFYILKKRIWLILGLTILGLAIAGGVSSFLITPQYETFATLMVGKPIDYDSEKDEFRYDDILLNERLVHTYAELVRSRAVSDRVMERLNLNMSYEELQTKLEVSLVNDTEIIKINVQNSDQELAAEIANKVSEEFIETAKDNMKVENVEVIDEAPVPMNPTSPKQSLNLIVGTVFGFMAGLFITFLLEYLDDTFKSSNEIEAVLQLPVLAKIPQIKTAEKGNTVKNNPRSLAAEAFRTMRTNVEFIQKNKGTDLLAITSTIPEEGKSTIITNLAILMRQEEKRILIVDADLRAPKIDQVINIPNKLGLTNILQGTNTLGETVQKISEVDGLYVITSGSVVSNPSELIHSKKMEDFIQSVRKEYDIVILNTPALGLVNDAALISTLVDGVVLVVEAGRTEIGQVEAAKKALENVDANIIGAVLSKVDIKNSGQGKYKQYYSYYGLD